MDDTLITQNSWYKLNLALGITADEDKEMYDAFVKGDLQYTDWTTKLVTLYKERGLASKANISKVLGEYTFNQGAVELVQNLQQKGYKIIILSGSFDILVSQVASDLGVADYKASTKLVFNDDNYLQELISEGDEQYAKLKNLESFCKESGVSIDQCVCVGDGANDVELFKATQKGITFNDAPENVKVTAWKVVATLSDINQIL